jgi:hypothetical protein
MVFSRPSTGSLSPTLAFGPLLMLLAATENLWLQRCPKTLRRLLRVFEIPWGHMIFHTRAIRICCVYWGERWRQWRRWLHSRATRFCVQHSWGIPKPLEIRTETYMRSCKLEGLPVLKQRALHSMLIVPKCFLYSFWSVTARNIHLRRSAPWLSWGTTLEIICVAPFVDLTWKLFYLMKSLPARTFVTEKQLYSCRKQFWELKWSSQKL